jgi:chemotaxis protein MotB
MKSTSLVTLVLALAFGGCATSKECNQKVADLEKTLQAKDAEIRSLQAEHEKLKTDEAKVDELSNANRALSRELQDEIKKGNITIADLKGRLTVSVVQEVLFHSGSAEIHAEGKKVLDKVARGLKGIDDRLIMVEGHTDDVPIGAKIAEKFPTNWELSTARATTVVRYLQERGVAPKHLGAAGFSEYRSVAPNDSDRNRQKNRRIDIVLTPELQKGKAE